VNISKSKGKQVDKKKSRKILTTSKSRNLVEALSDGFLSLRLGRRCLSRLLSSGLAAVATSQAFWDASSSASRDAMRALAIDKASAAGKREKESRIKNQTKANEIGKRHNLAKSLP
jgi:hypothetical protein